MRSSLDFILSGTEVRRYHTLTTLQVETVGHHSHGVAVICLLLDPRASASLLKAALYHDLAEHVTGDIPSPAKRIYGIGEQVSSLEEGLLSLNGLSMPELTEDEQRTLKLADIAQGALFCLREIELGNLRMRTVYDRYLSYYDGLGLQTPEEHALRKVIITKYEGFSK